MRKWMQISLMLCTFGFFREMRPSEPYVTEFLAGEWRNITSEQINKEVYPIGTYSVVAQMVIVFLFTDMSRYKPIIVLSAVAGIILFGMLLWTKTLLLLKIAQLFYGTFVAAEIAYYTYIYAKVHKEQFQIVTGHTRCAILSGKFLGGVLAQIFVSTNTMDFRQLHFISFGTQIISLFISIALPAVPKSLYFYAEPEVQREHIEGNLIEPKSRHSSLTPPPFSLRNACRLLWGHTKAAYTNIIVVRWSLWWALATCGQIQVITYIQFLWKEQSPDHVSDYNGAVEAIATILGAIGALIAGMLNSNKNRTTNMILICICTAILGVLMFTAGFFGLLILSYVNYIIFCAIFFFIITIAGAIIAENLVDGSFGLIFGINTLAAFIMQVILTVVVVTDSGFGLLPENQYKVYGGYFIFLSIAFLVAVVIPVLFKKICKKKTNEYPEPSF